MKKIFLGMMTFAALTACKKENSLTETNEISATDTATITQTEAPDIIPYQQVELNVKEMSEMLAKKDNDTLYITNFFATWCGPCVREIPHFREKMQETKSQPVKFTFVGLDVKEDWPTKVKEFVEAHQMSENTVLINPETLTPEFFPANFKQWDGGSIPFTFMRKGDKTDETIGMMSKEMLSSKINSFGK
ncbi:redoxin [Chryseobacterium sp. 6424]|uniref:TlpA family protein disulfide reductase n=1 Tax=Chryseobacterium sp. 6424 TaxID=2039166 RepID=UPI000EFC8292|nr:TlpA disulfide reductase family protein [Chryseobacterium sp. 6424]AYO57887.1 redoxin [Chryseobacterium sp. 6424]